MTKLQRMIEIARGHENVADVLFSCGEFTAAEIIEYAPQVLASREIDPIREGAIS